MGKFPILHLDVMYLTLNVMYMSRLQQSNLDQVVRREPKQPPFTVSGLLDYIVELIVFEDEAFLLVERGSFCQLLRYCRPALSDKDIPKRKTVRSEIIRRAYLAEEMIQQKFAVRVHLIYLRLVADVHVIGFSGQSVLYLRCMDFKTWGPIHFCHRALHYCTC